MLSSSVQPSVVCKVLPSLLLLLSAAMGRCHGQAEGNWKNCDEGLISILGVEVPDTVSAGTDATFTLQAESGERGASVELLTSLLALVPAWGPLAAPCRGQGQT